MAGAAEQVATETRIVRRESGLRARQAGCDICVVGAGIAGISAAVEAARLGRRVILVDSLPVLGGQAVNSIIGTFCGLYANGTHGRQFTHGIADEIIAALSREPGQIHFHRGPVTTIVYYDEVALGRWVERTVEAAGVTVLLGAVLRDVSRDGGRVQTLHFATRYGDVDVSATGFVDATGDAALTFAAGFECREPRDAKVYGTQMVVLENIVEDKHPTREQIAARMREKGDSYGLERRNCVPFVIPRRPISVLNMTHMETPLEPFAASRSTLVGRDQADRAVAFLKAEFPACFAGSRIRAYGNPGIRQTRWIAGRQQLTLEDVRAGTRFPDAIGRTAWPVELHDSGEAYVWEVFPEDHVHYIPLGALVPAEADNVVAAGRCADGDVAALSSIRVMGPCIAMGAAAAHALDLAGAGSLAQIDIAALRQRLAHNLED